MENDNQTINLENNIGGVQPPVFGDAKIVQPQTTHTISQDFSVQTQTIQSPVIPTPQSLETGSVTVTGEAITIEMPQENITVVQNMHSEVEMENTNSSEEAVVVPQKNR